MDYCYCSMFINQTGLIAVPRLPAVDLTDFCYDDLFENCEKLKYLPKLPATTLTAGCYRAMFYYCQNFKFSSTSSIGCSQEYRVPIAGIGITASGALDYMIVNTGGNINSMSLNTTLYVSDDVIIV